MTENDELTAQGKISAVKLRDTGYSIRIDDKWFGYYGKSPAPNKGDVVNLTYWVSDDGMWNNIKTIEVQESKQLGLQDAREDKAITILVECAKDQVIAELEYAQAQERVVRIPDLWVTAVDCVWQAYVVFKKKLNE